MFRMAVSCVLTALSVSGTIPVSAAELTVAEQVAKVKLGRKINVVLNNGETLKGRMGPVTGNQFALEPRNTAQGTARVVQFNEAQSVKTDGLTTGQKWAIFAAIWVAVGIVGKLTI